MIRTVVKLLSVALIAGGCAHRPQYKVYQIHDEFDDFTAFDMVDNFVGGNRTHRTLQLNISERLSADRETRYALHVVYEASHPLDIVQGESLVLLVDGQRMPFTTMSATERAEPTGPHGFRGESDPEPFAETADDTPVMVASMDDAAVLYASAPNTHRYPRHGRPVHRGLRHYYRYRPYYNYYLRPPYPATLRELSTPRVGQFHNYNFYPVWSYRGYPPLPLYYGPAAPAPYMYYPRRHHSSTGYEEMVYPVTLDELRRIAGAEDVRIRVEGRFFVYRHFTEHNFAIFQRFVEETDRRRSESTPAG